MKLRKFSILGISAFAIGVSACGGATSATIANKTANAANTVANTTASAVDTAANAVVVNTNSTTNANASTPAAASGDVLKIDEAGIMMVVPKGFKFSKDGEDTIVKTEDEGVEIRFTVPKDGDYDKAVSAAAEELDSYLDNVKIEEKATKHDVNGMEGTSMSGTAKDSDGDEVNWDLTIIDAPKKPVLVSIYAEKASMDKHAVDVQTFLKSVKKQ